MSIYQRRPAVPDRNVVSEELRGLRKLGDERRAASFASFRRTIRPTDPPKGKGPRRHRKSLAA